MVFDAENPHREQMDRLNSAAAGLNALDRLRLVVDLFGRQVVAATSFSAEDQVLTHMLHTLGNPIDLFTIDTGRLPQETFEVMEQTKLRYGMNIQIYFPDYRSVEAMVAEDGPNPFYKSVELRKQCCRMRKVEPLRRALSGKAAWVCGLRRSQSVTRQELMVIQEDEQFGLFKICPLADWTQEQVWEFIASHNIPYNSLHDDGYPSIGCQPCTRAVEPGQDIRAGRWWWEEPEHKECGLHWNTKS